MESAPTVLEGVRKGTAEELMGMVKSARALAPAIGLPDSYAVTHPAQAAANMTTMSAGMLHSVTHPMELAKELVAWDDWGKDPAVATGKVGFNLASLFADGGGAVGKAGSTAAKAGQAATDTAKSAASAVKSGVRNLASHDDLVWRGAAGGSTASTTKRFATRPAEHLPAHGERNGLRLHWNGELQSPPEPHTFTPHGEEEPHIPSAHGHAPDVHGAPHGEHPGSLSDNLPAEGHPADLPHSPGITDHANHPPEYNRPDFHATAADHQALRDEAGGAFHPKLMEPLREQLHAYHPGVQIPDEELVGMHRYTGMQHQYMNEAPRGGDQAALDTHGAHIRNAVSGMNKLPDFAGSAES